MDPRGFLAQFTKPVILDEAQRAPDLFSYIQGTVDTDDRPGRFILTGSQNFLLVNKISQTLAGRCGILHLLPFSRSEIEESTFRFPESVDELLNNRSTRLDIWKIIQSGFYPRIHDKKIPPAIWLSDYVQTYLERDVRNIVNIGDIESFGKFLGLCAGRTGQLLNYSNLSGDCGISVDTARRWISVLKATFVIFLLKPHHRNFNKRLIKSPKLYFFDTGLACHLLGIKAAEQLPNYPLRGALFENYIIAEVMKTYLHHRLPPPLYYWRDQSGHEIDLLIEDSGGVYPIEIKSGQTVVTDMVRNLKWWCRLATQSEEQGTLIYGGTERFTRKGISVRPWYSI